MAARNHRPVLRSGSLQVHHRLAVGFSDKNLSGEEMIDEFFMGPFWKRIFAGIQDPLFEQYDENVVLDLVVLTPEESGLYAGNSKISLRSFFSHIATNFPELDLVKPEVAFRIREGYQLEMGEVHYFAVSQPGVKMRTYNLITKEVGSGFSYGGLRLLGVPHLSKRDTMYRLLQFVPQYDTHWTTHDTKWVFALKSQGKAGAVPWETSDRYPHQDNGALSALHSDELLPSRVLVEQQIDAEFDDVALFARTSNTR